MKKIIEAATKMHENITSGKEINEGYASEKKRITNSLDEVWSGLSLLAEDLEDEGSDKLSAAVQKISDNLGGANYEWLKIVKKIK
jgi:hypothetical protein